MKSKMLIGLSKSIRFAILDTSNIAKQAVELGGYDDMLCTAEIAMLNIAAVISSSIKEESSNVKMVLKADGLLGSAKAKAKYDGNVISSVKIDKEKIEKLNQVQSLDEFKDLYKIGKGVLLIEKNLSLKSPYFTKLDINEDETIEEVISRYYKTSEQVETILKTGIKFNEDNSISKTGAIFIQKLPDAKEEDFLKFKKKLDMIHSIQELLHHDFSLEKIAHLIYEDVDDENKELIEEYKILEEKDLYFSCDCSLEYFKDLLKGTVDKKELEEYIKADGFIETVCGFCNASYRIYEI